MKILLLAFTSKIYKSEGIYTGTSFVYTDRADLTRKLSCMDTWVPRVEEKGHEVIFFDGGNDELSFDVKNKILHLTCSDSYDYHYLHNDNKPSHMFVRLREAIRWALQNREFDYVLRIDDGSYVNAYALENIYPLLEGKDIAWSGYGGGGGIFFSKRACKEFITLEGTNEYHLEDMTIFNSSLFHSDSFEKITTELMSSTYVIGENLLTTHYSTGKRMYLADFITSAYHNNVPVPRKVILNYPLDATIPLKTNTIDGEHSNTQIWYGLDKDTYNWEYYGAYTRSGYQALPVAACYKPFGINSIKNLFIYNLYNSEDSSRLEQYLLYYYSTLQEKGTIYLFHNTNYQHNVTEIENILNNNNISYTKLNINIKSSITTEYILNDEDGVLLTIEK